jgi:hypothetical protein
MAQANFGEGPAEKPDTGNMFDNLTDKLKTIFKPPAGSALEKDVLAAKFVSAQYGLDRAPWLMYLRSSLLAGPVSNGVPGAPNESVVGGDGMAWAVNPSEVTWSMPLRATHSKNLYGTVLHTWLDDVRGTFFDEFRISFKFQSGNIMPVWIGGTVPKVFKPVPGLATFKGAEPGMVASVYTEEFQEAHGLVNFYDFLNLLDAPKITGTGEVNMVYITYQSPTLPRLTLKGMFDTEGMRWTDSASEPNQINSWTAEFVVYDTIPRMTSPVSGGVAPSPLKNNTLLQVYLDAMINKKSALKDAFGDALKSTKDLYNKATVSSPGGNAASANAVNVQNGFAQPE